ncbi:leucine-rich repeat-containing protein 15-like [Aphidius gifuensis]|uniref:leucine-rich repeat-containing protein 15-like n=1 Tax=Aphidius gifuensis TaxID=684658 RepID=UPI001CDC6C59|nr:leucine-rich repeat-containing protein 15-like [Aphidius gifuensis]
MKDDTCVAELSFKNMGVLLMMQANLVAGIFMLIIACSPVVSGSSEINSPTTSTVAPNIPNKSSIDNDDVGSWDVFQNQIELQIYMAISFMLDKYFVDEFNNKFWQIYKTLKQVNQEIEQTLDKCSETLITCGNRFLSVLDQQVNLEKKPTILELEMKNNVDNKLESMICSKNQQYSNISLELEKKIDENKQLIEESIALKKQQAEELKATENEYQLNLTNEQQELEILKELFFEINHQDLVESAELLKTLISIMKFNEYNVPDNLLKKREKLFKLNYNKNQAVVVNYLRKRFDNIALASNSQFPNRYFCNKKMSYYDSTICACLSENSDNYEINLIHRNLAVLPEDIFTGFENAEKLRLSFNSLYWLESGTFNNLSNLKILKIRNNQLTSLLKDTFTGLKNLRTLDLSYNQLDYLESGTFNNLSNLQQLSFNNNNLTELSSDIFNDLEKLRWLELSRNKLNCLQPGTFENLSNLQKLDISRNNLTALSNNTFNGLEKLRWLELSRNKINFLKPGTFNYLSNLQKLDISHNNLTELSRDIFNGLKKLTSLNLSANKVNSLQPGTFNNLSNLNYLLIHENRLTSLPKNIFTGLKNLRVLLLSDNRLSYLDSNIFNNLPALNELNIEENNLTTETIYMLKNMHSFRNFQLWL